MSERSRRPLLPPEDWLPFNWPVKLPATIKDQHFRRIVVNITELSMIGCRISTPARLDVGQNVLVKLAYLSPLRSVVTVSDRPFVELRFERALAFVVLDDIVAQHLAIPHQDNDLALVRSVGDQTWVGITATPSVP